MINQLRRFDCILQGNDAIKVCVTVSLHQHADSDYLDGAQLVPHTFTGRTAGLLHDERLFLAVN
jgi:hypothetical protein